MTECNPSALLENAQFGCWSAEYNTEVLKRRTELSLQNSEQDQLTLKDPTGRFLEDYMKACGCIGVVPHPEVAMHNLSFPKRLPNHFKKIDEADYTTCQDHRRIK